MIVFNMDWNEGRNRWRHPMEIIAINSEDIGTWDLDHSIDCKMNGVSLLWNYYRKVYNHKHHLGIITSAVKFIRISHKRVETKFPCERIS